MAIAVLPRLTEAQIRKLATEPSFQRGDRYYQQGRILNPMRQDAVLWADCQGSELYQPRVTLGKQGVVSADCTCPYDWGGLCKHQVALLLAYVHQPDTFHVVPPVSEMLASRSREDLIELVELMVQRYPNLLSLVELSTAQPQPGQALDLSIYRRQAQRALRQEDMEAIATDLQPLMDTADQLLQQDNWLWAGALYQMLLAEITASYDDNLQAIDYDGDVCVVAQDAADGLGKCLAQARSLDSETRAIWLHTLLDAVLKDMELGGIDYAYAARDALLESATGAEWEWVEDRIRGEVQSSSSDRWTRDALVRLLADRQKQQGSNDSARNLIHELGSPEQRAFLLVEEGKIETAMAIARQHFTHLPGLMLQFADALVVAHAQTQAVELIAQLAQQEQSRGYREWLTKYYQEYGDPQTALNWQQQIFWDSPSLEGYKQLQKLGQKADTWEQLRDNILQKLQQHKQLLLLTHIAFYEQNIERVLELFPQLKEWEQSRFRQPLAKAIETTHPQMAIALYQQLATRAIEQKNRPAYQEAVQHLQRVKTICESCHTLADWTAYITQLRSQYPTLRALHDELFKAKL
jgi:uncharacterized Zn finger protein